MIQHIDHTYSLDTTFLGHPLHIGFQRISPFDGHSLAVTHESLMERVPWNNCGWILGVVALVSLLYCLFIRRHRIKLLNLLQATVTRRQLDMLMRESNIERFGPMVQLFFCYAVTLALLICYGLPHLLSPSLAAQMPTIDPLLYMLTTAVLFLAIALRSLACHLLGNTLADNSKIRVYLFNTEVYLLVDLITLLPLLLLIIFSPISRIALVITLMLMGLLYLMRLIRGMQLILTMDRGAKFYLFYYLCIVEIVPIIVIAKLLTSSY